MKFKLSREFANNVRFIVDEFIPPILRDSYWFSYLPYRLLFGKKADMCIDFKKKAATMTPEEYGAFYANIGDIYIQRETDLSEVTIQKVLENLEGKEVADIGCGRAYLTDKIHHANFSVTGVDITIEPHIQKKYPHLKFVEGNVENLPFESKSFDTVVCAHTLEHVLNFQQSILELRRICKKRLIIVLPQQRPYKYTFDLHLRFFPYPHLFQLEVGRKPNSFCEEVGGDLFYVEDIS